MDLDERLFDRVCISSGLGMASLICGPATVASYDSDDAEDRSDCKLAVRVADLTDGSELADDMAGDSVPLSAGY